MRKVINISAVFLVVLFFIQTQSFSAERGGKVILKAYAENPSEEETYTVPFTIYLPKEVQRENIIDAEDFQIKYDIQQGVLYGFKEVELKPGESLLKKITLQDVWYFTDERLDEILKYMDGILKELSTTRHAQRAESLKADIVGKMNLIREKQSAVIDSAPQKHIAVYRENETIMEKIKEDIRVLDRLLIQSREVLGVNIARKLTVETTWRVIVLTAALLLLLSLIFFFIWRRQIALSQQDSLSEAEAESFYTPEQRKGE